MIHQPREDTRVVVIGVPGQGKSVWRDRYIGTMLRCTLWNPMGDYPLGRTVTVDEYGKNIERMRRGALHITVEPTSYDTESMAEEFDTLCAYVEEVGAQHFAIEEIALVTTPVSVPGNLNKLYVRGRHRHISLSAYGQRFHQFPLIVRGTASEIIAFRQTDPDDVKDFEKRILPNVSPIRINELPDFHFVRWTPDDGPGLSKPLPLKQEKQNNGARESNSDFRAYYGGNDGDSAKNPSNKETHRPYTSVA